MWMARKFPSQVRLDADEVYRINRIRVARYLHITPADVDEMAQSDYADVCETLWFEAQG
jgi:hypothetical protein